MMMSISRAAMALELPDRHTAAPTTGDSPNSLAQGSKPTNAEPFKPTQDFFSLGESPVLPELPSSSMAPTAIHVSSAPDVKQYEPPVPTPMDPYPGYYQMPSGQWAAYDTDYYRTFWDEWQKATLPQQEKGFEAAEGQDLQSVSAKDEMDRGRKEIEDKKSLTKNIKTGPDAPRMNIKRAKAGSLARTRHQLSTLLTDAYENREALEEKIAEGRRNRKEAGNKYGF